MAAARLYGTEGGSVQLACSSHRCYLTPLSLLPSPADVTETAGHSRSSMVAGGEPMSSDSGPPDVENLKPPINLKIIDHSGNYARSARTKADYAGGVKK